MSEIAPEKQNIDTLFSTTSYFIDFYQREYKWGEDEVRTLLDDIFLKFNTDYDPNLEPNPQNIERKYSWYYLNTYITNRSDGNVYIVDGQQRLTTISLILVSLLRMGQQIAPEDKDLLDWLEDKIHGNSPMGKVYWMGHRKNGGIEEERVSVMNSLLAGQDFQGNCSLTGENMIQNYKLIEKYLSQNLTDNHKFQAFIYYFLRRVVIVNLDVNQSDVAMVFEVINDRGLRLNPYEILKGKLLGKINKSEVNGFNEIWEKNVLDLEKVKDKELVDSFFRTYFKAKFAHSRVDSKDFDGPYHKTIFDKKYKSQLVLEDPNNIKKFLREDFTFYVNIFKKLIAKEETMEEFPELYFNYLNDLTSQEMVIMSIIGDNDTPDLIDEKIRTVSREIERLFAFLQLTSVYESNRFLELLFILMDKLKEREPSGYRNEFDKVIIDEINIRKNTNVNESLPYRYFKEAGYNTLNLRFLRYFFARIEYYLTENLGTQTQDSIWNYIRATGKDTSYHIEHILGMNNQQNLSYFESEEEFEIERNRLGALLLLKGQDNQSSGNESYSEKLKTYQHTLCWNQTLTENYYHANTSIRRLINETGLDIRPISIFDKDAIEKRSKLLYEIFLKIWE